MAAPSDGRTLTRASLASALRAELGVPGPMAARILDETLEAMEDALLDPDDGRIQITGFGTFDVVERGPRPARNPRTNQVVPLPARRVVRFRPARRLHALLREKDDP